MAAHLQNTQVTADSLAGERQSRLLFIDNIRWSMIVLVICHHAAVTYSHVGGWYYMDGAKPAPLVTILFATFETFNQAYFMGFLFLIAGYFVPRAFDRKGFTYFLRDRFIRLGVPSLLFALIIHPITVYWLLRFDDPSIPPLPSAYGRFISSGKVFSADGPMWFAVALLIFCAVYALFRRFRQAPIMKPALPGNRAILGLILLMGTGSFLVRIVQPIGVNILNMQLCYFTQYVLLFVVGILSYRGNWLLEIPRSLGVLWFKVALAAGIIGWPALLVASGLQHGTGDTQNLLGGFHWQSAGFCYWEAFFCLGACLGLTVLFREKFNTQSSPLVKWLSRNNFAAYLFHTPLLIAVTLALRPLAQPTLIKFVLACLLAVPITFIVSAFIRERVTVFRRLL